MSVSRLRSKDLLSSYQLGLERQVQLRGSGLASADQELRAEAEGLLREGGAEEAHCLGLDALRVMEESLEACGRRGRPRAGLQGLAKAFQVLEQAALNLYLGPWREEYKVIKMYSGTFTHVIVPVLSAPQIHALFGLLGYHAASTRGEQLRLQWPGGGAASPDDLLRLSCAFFLARCECCLLLAALGKHGGDAEWELSVVRERQRGHSLQGAVDVASTSLDASRPAAEPLDADVDLYGDEPPYGAVPQAGDHESPRSLAWVTQSDAEMDVDAAASSPPEPAVVRSSSAERRERRRPCGESRSERPDGERSCRCLLAPHAILRHCFDCDAVHDLACASLHACNSNNHCVASVDGTGGDTVRSRSPQDDELCAAALASVALSDQPDSLSPSHQPISFHDCCDLTRLDPRLLCRTCSVFHSGACPEKEVCQARHDVRRLGSCSCGRFCSRKPLVLCRYCGTEFCNDCWYRRPVFCSCGKTFDQSSSV